MAANGAKSGVEDWEASTRVFLSPIAAPSILGLFGFAGATFIVAMHEATGYGGSDATSYLFPFAALFGGVAQFTAGIWSYRARDGLATAMHGMWGSFWIAFGILELLLAIGVLQSVEGDFVEFGYWFVVLSAVTFAGAMAAHGENIAIAVVLHTLWAGAALLALANFVGAEAGSGWASAAGWVLVASAVLAWYTASAMMLAAAYGKTILPLGELEKGHPLSPKRAANVPGDVPKTVIQLDSGEPGVKQGQ